MAMNQWIACTDPLIIRMDNGKTNPQILAGRIAARCQSEFAAVVDINTQGLTGAELDQARRRLSDFDTNRIAEIIRQKRLVPRKAG